MAALLPFVRETPTGVEPGVSPVETSEAPRSALSAGQIAQPYAELASALDKTSENLDKVAVPLAERAGAEAVTRGPDGSIQVEHMPIFGLAGADYARAMK